MKEKYDQLQRKAFEMAVNPVWDKYYPGREEISQEEVSELVKLALEKIEKPQFYNQMVFEMAFKRIDFDGNGNLEKREVVDLVQIIVKIFI